MGKYSLTDSGNVARFLDAFGSQVRYVEAWHRFLVWSGSKWEEDPRGDRTLGLTESIFDLWRNQLQEEGDAAANEEWAWYFRSQSVKARKAIVELLRGKKEIASQPEDWDANPWLLGIGNGVLDLKEGTHRPYKASDRLTKHTPVPFIKDAPCGRWKRFLKEVLPDQEVRDFLQRFVGYCLTGNTGERLIVVCYGEGRNGKSVLIRVLQELLGPLAITTDPELLLEQQNTQHATGVMDLFGVRMAVTSEVKEKRKWDTEKLKRLTGGSDVIRGRRMREDFWEYRPTAKLIVVTNDQPRAPANSPAFWDRIALIPFTVRIKDEDVDKELLQKLCAELPGIMQWGLRGLKAWQTSGLRVPKAVQEASKDYRHEEDLIGQFFDDCLKFNPVGEITTQALNKVAELWCTERGLHVFNNRELRRRLRDKKATEWRTNSQRGWKGVYLGKDERKRLVRDAMTPGDGSS